MTTQEQFATFNTVDLGKDKLLSILQENREKHNFLYNASVSGYYDEVKDWKLRTSEYATLHAVKFANADKSLQRHSDLLMGSINDTYEFGKPAKQIYYPDLRTDLDKIYPTYPVFPTSYEKDYNEAIRKVELSIHGNFRLSEQEFQQYVMNNWAWKKAFVDLGTNYLNKSALYMTTGCYIGPAGNTGPAGVAGIGTYTMPISISGCLASF